MMSPHGFIQMLSSKGKVMRLVAPHNEQTKAQISFPWDDIDFSGRNNLKQWPTLQSQAKYVNVDNNDSTEKKY